MTVNNCPLYFVLQTRSDSLTNIVINKKIQELIVGQESLTRYTKYILMDSYVSRKAVTFVLLIFYTWPDSSSFFLYLFMSGQVKDKEQ